MDDKEPGSIVSSYSWPRAVIICLALLLEGISSSSITVQIGRISDDFEPGRALLGMIATAFLVAYAGLLPVAGQIVDAVDKRLVFLTGVILFGLGCLICAAAPDAWVLVAGRFVQGLGAALSAPAALALITAGLPEGPLRNRVVALYGTAGAAGFSLGLVIPGIVVTSAGWRASFLILVPIVILIFALSRYITHSAEESNGQKTDLMGAILLTATMIVAISAIAGIGSFPGWVLALEGAFTFGLAAVIVHRRNRTRWPTEVVRSLQVLAMSLSLSAIFAGGIASMYVASLALQFRYGTLPSDVGLLTLPQPIVFSLLSGVGGRLVTRFGPGFVMANGMLIIIVSLIFLGNAAFISAFNTRMLPAMACIGLGMALCYPAATIGAVNAVPERCRGMTIALLTTSQNVGGATGIALVTALAAVPEKNNATGPGLGMMLSAGLIAAGGLGALAISAWNDG